MASKVYLLHYLQDIGDPTKPTGYARHYLGSTSRSLKQRLAEHAAGQGAKITAEERPTEYRLYLCSDVERR